MKLFATLLAGLLFGAGLVVSDMVNPARVLAFLDVTGNWDPTLAFVMAGALVVMAIAWRFMAPRGLSVLGDAFTMPTSTIIDTRLIGGAALFGIGWGLVGLCPGPALSALAFAPVAASIFVAAMVAGMLVHRLAMRA